MKWRLLWARGALPTNLDYTELTQSVNLSSGNLAVLKKHYASGRPTVPEFIYAPLHGLVAPLTNTSRVGLRPSSVHVKGLHLTLSDSIWVVSVARKKIDSQHVFLILEGVVNFRQFIIKAHLTTPGKTAIIGVFAIKKEGGTLEELDKSIKDYDSQQWQISKKQALKLIGNIREDQCTTINYKLLGDQGSKCDPLGKEYHNCVTWCRKQLRLIGIELPDQWYNIFVTLPQDVIAPPAAIAQANSSTPHPSLFSSSTSVGSSSNSFFDKTQGDSMRDMRAGSLSQRKETRSILDNRRLIDDGQWAISLTRKKGGASVCLILQGQVNDQNTIILPDKLAISSLQLSSPELLSALSQSKQPGIIRSTESAKKHLSELASNHEFQGCLLSTAEAEQLLISVILRQNSRSRSSASMSSFRSENALDLHSYIGILSAVKGFEYSDNWHPIQLSDNLTSAFYDGDIMFETVSTMNLGDGQNSNN